MQTPLKGKMLFSLTSGFGNTAAGFITLHGDTTGSFNTAIGFQALAANTTGSDNTAVASGSLFSNTTGGSNTAVGSSALFANTTGGSYTATGVNALSSNLTGRNNAAHGVSALTFNTSGSRNTANGEQALYASMTGNNNTADGSNSLYRNLGSDNAACGFQSLYNNTAGNNNIALGSAAGINLTSGSNNIEIGNSGVANESGVIRIGAEGTQTATYIAGIMTSPLASALAIGISPTGQLGVRGSSARFKEAIKPMDKASEAILSLRPVTFRYKKEFDPKATPQFGLVAEEVAKVDPDLVARDASGKPFPVRYHEVNAMLLNEFLKGHGKVEEQGKEIAELRSALKE